jgi:hypothetical protein
MLILQLLPEQLSPWMLLLFIIVVLSMDALLVFMAASLGVVLIAFKAGRAVLQYIDKAVNWVIYTAFRLVEDVLESPPLDKVPILQLLLVGVKKAYDIVNGAQALIMFAVNAVVTFLAIVFMLVFILGLAAINIAAIGLVIRYIT